MGRRSIQFKRSWWEAIRVLDDCERLELFDAIMRYAFEDEEPKLRKKACRAVWPLIKEDVDSQHEPSKRGGGRRKLSDKKRFMVMERDGFRCRYCGAAADEARLEVDHVVPVSKGGGDDMGNLVTACRECNSGKRAHVIGEPRRWSK